MQSSWTELVQSIIHCADCEKFTQLIPSTKGIVFPDPYQYCPRVKLLLISWAPPGTARAVETREFFHNSEARDNMRTKIFNGLTGKREDFSLDPKFPKESLESFYRLGLYLVPTVLRRIEGNAVPGDAIINHSSKTHLMAVLNHIVSRQRSLKVILLGATPSRAFVNLFPGVEAGRKLAAALMKKRPVEEARKLTLTSPLRFQMRGNSWLDVWLSYWPRAQGVHYLSADILRVLDSQESWLFGRVCVRTTRPTHTRETCLQFSLLMKKGD